MNVKHTYEGESGNESLQEAIEAALRMLAADLNQGGVRDASASWAISEISGTHGGLAGSRSIKVTIASERTPPWGA
ncbi:hypothetical protein DFR50_14643 [Roseiarcus fermentans]|uniref:Uncharacterized protein n=1 Tax=Roseiarcus fermentans TaxID=1473586 RepID=A0A366ENP9_9HYPH|nr:hypothetical protein [Roseiarcus fermentans]RBP03119.1 hypothetical protein DFR50_14643 [Roseiarcus fermentans]